MQFDFQTLDPGQRYEFLLGTVVPRPVAIVVTCNPDGSLNGAPYSLFNVMSHDPPIVALSVLTHAENRFKDTAANILATGEFALSMVPQSLAAEMNLSCIDAPAGIDELALAGLQTAPSTKIKPPRVKSSPVSFECRMRTSLSFGVHQLIVLAEVVQAYVADEYVADVPPALVDTPKLDLIGAMHGARWYARTGDLFAMDRPNWADWIRQGKAT
jgi:flavin reductase (DIM6/NTAB) family NADH-FMN oxidoreductase RutF